MLVTASSEASERANLVRLDAFILADPFMVGATEWLAQLIGVPELEKRAGTA